jgi:lipopolysaccharide transport system ATP-binding protein
VSVITVENIGKRYRVGELEAGGLLRDQIASALSNPASLLRRKPRDEFWALRDISFEVQEGEVLGLIGRNGAGKSTLLKILSRITAPTVGRAEIHGRVGSLLEVGTGFHPELTGRENVFLNGAILGMGKREIARKFDEIVAFAEVERFIDTPVKRYSSGMYVRLAFAVAAHLETEVLFVDEVLSVGDVQFQKKCLGKMGDVARHGRTVIFVSHNMAAINALCPRCLILKSGQIELDAPTDKATARYHAQSIDKINGFDLSDRRREGTGKARFTSIRIEPTDSVGHRLSIAYPGCDLTIDVDLECESGFDHANLAIIFYDSNGYRVIDANTAQKGESVKLEAGQSARANFRLREVLLKPGTYLIGLWLGREGVDTIDHVEYATTIEVAAGYESRAHTAIYPGMYLCRFEQSVSIFDSALGEPTGSRSVSGAV